MTTFETNVLVSSQMDNMLENNITIQNLMLEMEKLKRAKEHSEATLAILEANEV